MLVPRTPSSSVSGRSCSKALRRSDLCDPAKQLAKGAFPTLGQIARDQFRMRLPARLIDPALARDVSKNLY